MNVLDSRLGGRRGGEGEKLPRIGRQSSHSQVRSSLSKLIDKVRRIAHAAVLFVIGDFCQYQSSNLAVKGEEGGFSVFRGKNPHKRPRPKSPNRDTFLPNFACRFRRKKIGKPTHSKSITAEMAEEESTVSIFGGLRSIIQWQGVQYSYLPASWQ